MTIQELAAAREAAWLAAHPDGHEYEQHDLLTEAQEELADFYNYVGASSLPIAVRFILQQMAREAFNTVERWR